MDDNTSHLEEAKIDRQLGHRGGGTQAGPVRNGGNEGGMYKRILEALIVLAVAALIGAVWNLTQTATLLGERQDAQRRDFERMERRQDALEGKLTRGDFDAPDQQ